MTADLRSRVQALPRYMVLVREHYDGEGHFLRSDVVEQQRHASSPTEPNEFMVGPYVKESDLADLLRAEAAPQDDAQQSLEAELAACQRRTQQYREALDYIVRFLRIPTTQVAHVQQVIARAIEDGP